jgi:hypothetical protein
MDGERYEDEEEMDIQVAEDETSTIPHADPNVPFEPDAEDLATDELTHLKDSATDKYEAYLVIDADKGGNTTKHKSSILRIFSDNDPNSTDRLKRVMDLSRFDPAGRGLAVGHTFDPTEPCVSILDPAATLVRSKDLIWLALVQIVDLCLDNSGMQTLPTRILGEPNVGLRVQVMSIAPVAQGSKNEDGGDWEWTGHFEKLAGSTSTCEISGHRLQLLNPAILSPTCPGNKSPKTYRFSSVETVAIAKLLHEKLRNESDRLPTVPWTTSFPYRTQNGM